MHILFSVIPSKYKHTHIWIHDYTYILLLPTFSSYIIVNNKSSPNIANRQRSIKLKNYSTHINKIQLNFYTEH